MLKISPDTNLVSLFRAAKAARGEVWFQTTEGDRLNMKSLLSQYIILAAFDDENNTLWKNAEVVCENEEDVQLLTDSL